MKSPGGLYVPVLWKEDSDGLLLHFLPSQIWPGGQQRPVALLQQIEPFGQQTLPQELWPCSQQRPIALLAQNEPFEQQTLPQELWPRSQQRPIALLAQNEPFEQQTLPQELWPRSQQRPIALLAQNEPFEQQTSLPPTLPQGVSPGLQLPLPWSARAVPDPKTETNAAPAIPRRMCPNACRRGIGLARVREMSSNSLFSFIPLLPFSGSHCRHLLGDERQDLGDSLRDVPRDNPFLIDEKSHRHRE